MFHNQFPCLYNKYNSLPLQVWLNNINNTNNTNNNNLIHSDDEANEDYNDYNLSKQDIVKHIKLYLNKNNIDYNYLAKSIYKNISNNCNTSNFDDLEIYNYLNKYYMHNQDFLINIILDLIIVNKTYDLYDLTKLNGIEKNIVKNFSNDILKIINEKTIKKTYDTQNAQFSTIEKKVMTLERNIKMLIDEINIINSNNNTLSKDLHIIHNNYQQLKSDFNNLNNNYMNLKVKFDDINYVLNDIMDKSKDNTDEETTDEEVEKKDNEQQNINFVIKDVEKIGDNVANELYKIIN